MIRLVFEREDDGDLVGRAIERRNAARDRLELKERLSEAQNHRCCFCGVRMGYFGDWQRQPTFEHVLARSRGGSDHIDNLVISCSKCNSERGDGLRKLMDELGAIKQRLHNMSDYLYSHDNIPGRKKLAQMFRDAQWLYDKLMAQKE